VGESGGFLLKSTIISTVFKLQVVKTAPDSQLFNLLSVSRLVTVLNKADQCAVICKLQELDGGSSDVQLFMYREKSSGERTQP